MPNVKLRNMISLNGEMILAANNMLLGFQLKNQTLTEKTSEISMTFTRQKDSMIPGPLGNLWFELSGWRNCCRGRQRLAMALTTGYCGGTGSWWPLLTTGGWSVKCTLSSTQWASTKKEHPPHAHNIRTLWLFNSWEALLHYFHHNSALLGIAM